jgi:uncharacterized protein YxeA
MKSSLKVILAIVVAASISLVFVDGDPQNTTADTTTTTTLQPSTSVAPENECSQFNSSCEDCVKRTKCYYCYSIKRCIYYPYSHIIPSWKDCELADVRWAVCWLNFKALIVGLSVTLGVLVISLIICICCCCRRKKTGNSRKYAREEAKQEREREERRIRSEERRNERNVRNDEIRRKYGLIKDDHPYHRFDA